MKAPAEIVAAALAQCPVESRAGLLREMLAHVAAGLVTTEGHKEAAEAVYRMADAVVSRGTREAA
jgi:uncharacterized small protein (DUF1192 family)